MLTQDKEEEELVMFLEIRRLEKGPLPAILMGSDNKSRTTAMSSQHHPLRRTAAENFLYSESEKSDYEWLVTPPGSPSKSVRSQLDAPDTNLVTLISRLENYSKEETDNVSSKNQTTVSVSEIRRPSSASSSRSTSRLSTPTRRSTLTSSSTSSLRSTNRPSSSSGTSRVTLSAARITRPTTSTGQPTTGSAISTRSNNRLMSAPNSKPGSRSSTPTRRPSTPTTMVSTPTPRATLTSSSTSSLRSTSRPSSSSGTSRVTLSAAHATRPTSSTGSATSTRSNNRPMSAPNSKPGSRSSTPSRRPSTPTGSSNVLRRKPTKPVSKPDLSQGASPIVRSRPWEPYEMPGFSIEAPSNLRTTLPDRPQTASSSRVTTFGVSSGSRSPSIERDGARRQSCSPSRSRAPIGNVNGAVNSLRGRREKTKNEDVGLTSHLAKGNQKVERVVNMRKLPPPRLTETGGRGLGGGVRGGSSAGKSSSGSDGIGFGRRLSKSSIDMALRHLDVKRGSMAGNFRPSVMKVPATSLYSVRNRPVSSSGSSESSVNILCLDGSDDNLSDISYS